MYDHFNEEYFENRLSKEIDFGWRYFKKEMALTHWLKNGRFYMEFDLRLRPKFFQRQLGFTMFHEMNHMQLGYEVDCMEWGGKFDEGMLELAKKNAFRGLW